MARSLLGTVISGRYRIEELLTETSTAALFRGEHVLMHKRIAVKVVSPRAAARPDVLARFEREAIAGAHVDHPNVAAAKDFGALEDGAHFLVMEYLDGPTLRKALEGGALALDRALRIVRQIALALDAAHAKGIVHRALRPENIHLVQRGGERDVVKVVDFGSAKLPAELVATGAAPAGRADRIATPIAAIPAYASPELVIGREVDERTDLYALGVILYELITGSCPSLGHEGEPPRLARAGESAVIPDDLEALARRLVDDDPQHRPGAIEVVDTIDSCLAALHTSRRLALGGLLGAPQSSGILPEAVSATILSPGRAPDRDSAPVEKSARRSPLHVFDGVPRSILLVAGGALATVLLVVIAIGLRAPFPPDEAESPGASPLRHGPTELPSASSSSARIGASAPSSRASEEEPDAPALGAREIWSRLGKELSSGRFSDAVGSLDKLLEQDSKAYQDREVRSAIVELASRVSYVDGADTDRMFDMIETRMGTVGPDILFELMATKGGSKAAKRAEDLLRDKSVRERGTPALRVAYELRAARKCDQKIALLERARDDGDGRSYGALQMMNRDCRRSDECCLRKDPRLKEAMDAIRDRTR